MLLETHRNLVRFRRPFWWCHLVYKISLKSTKELRNINPSNFVASHIPAHGPVEISYQCIRGIVTSESRRVVLLVSRFYHQTLQWRQNDRDGVSNHQPHGCLLNRLFRRRSKKTSSSASLAFVWGIHRDRWAYTIIIRCIYNIFPHWLA